MSLALAADNFYIAPTETLYSPVALDAVLTGSTIALTPISAMAREAAKLYFSEMGGKPTLIESQAYGGLFSHLRRPWPNSLLISVVLCSGGAAVRYSNRYEALGLYFSRLVRPVWKARIVTA